MVGKQKSVQQVAIQSLKAYANNMLVDNGSSHYTHHEELDFFSLGLDNGSCHHSKTIKSFF